MSVDEVTREFVPRQKRRGGGSESRTMQQHANRKTEKSCASMAEHLAAPSIAGRQEYEDARMRGRMTWQTTRVQGT